MFAIKSEFDSLYHHFGGDDWKWFAAIAMHESGENPFAIGDDGLAWGLFQMHPDFWRDHSPVIDATRRGDIFLQFCALRSFWSRYSARSVEERLAIFNQGPTGARKHILAADNYVAAVKAEYDKLDTP